MSKDLTNQKLLSIQELEERYEMTAVVGTEAAKDDNGTNDCDLYRCGYHVEC